MLGINELRAEVRALRYENKSLSERVAALEVDTQPFRVGAYNPGLYFVSYQTHHDPRPKVSMRKAIEQIMAHLKINFTKTEAIPEIIKVEKVAK